MLHVIDIAFLLVILLFVSSGFMKGFVRTLGNLIGLVAGIVLAGYGVFWIDQEFGISSQPILALVLFLVLAAFVSRLVAWIVDVIDGLRQVLSIIPFFSLFNRFLGGILGLAQGALIVGAFVFVVGTYIPDGRVKDIVVESYTASLVSRSPGFVKWLFPSFELVIPEDVEETVFAPLRKPEEGDGEVAGVTDENSGSISINITGIKMPSWNSIKDSVVGLYEKVRAN